MIVEAAMLLWSCYCECTIATNSHEVVMIIDSDKCDIRHAHIVQVPACLTLVNRGSIKLYFAYNGVEEELAVGEIKPFGDCGTPIS